VNDMLSMTRVKDPRDFGQLLPGAKQVIINDYLPEGQVYATAHEVIMTRATWEAVRKSVERHLMVKADVKSIVDRVLGKEIAWLRQTGHDLSKPASKCCAPEVTVTITPNVKPMLAALDRVAAALDSLRGD
jgi:hypothetical protein